MNAIAVATKKLRSLLCGTLHNLSGFYTPILCTLLLCAVGLGSTSRSAQAATPSPNAATCGILSQANAEAIAGQPLILQSRNTMGGIIFICIYATDKSTAPANAAGIMAVYGPPNLEESILDRLHAATPEREEIYQQVLAAYNAQAWPTLFTQMRTLAADLPAWHSEATVTNEAYTLYLRQKTAISNQIYWSAVGKELPVGFQIIAELPLTVTDDEVAAALTQTTEQLLKESIDLYQQGNQPAPPGQLIPTATATSTPSPQPTIAPTTTTLPPAALQSQATTLTVALDQPFNLRIGQTAILAGEDLAGEDLRVTLRSLSDDSGCVDEACSSSIADGSIVFTQDGEAQAVRFIAFFEPNGMLLNQPERYDLVLERIDSDEEGNKQATLRLIVDVPLTPTPTPFGYVQTSSTADINPSTAPTATPSPTPMPSPDRRPIRHCPFLTYLQATRILTESIAENLDGDTSFCGYGGVAQQFLSEGVAAELETEYGVAVGRFAGEAAVQLVQQLVDTMGKEMPSKGISAYSVLRDNLAQGNLADVTSLLGDMMSGAKGWYVTEINYAGAIPALLMNDLHNNLSRFYVLAQDPTGQLIFILGQMPTKNQRVAFLENLYAVVAAQTQQGALPKEVCDLLPVKTAATILGQQARLDPELLSDVTCAYRVANPAKARPGAGVRLLLHVRHGDRTAAWLRWRAEILRSQSPKPAEKLLAQFHTYIAEGDYVAALDLLPSLTVDAEEFAFTKRPELGAHVIGSSQGTRREHNELWVTITPDGTLLVLSTSFAASEDESARQEALDAAQSVMKKLLRAV